MSEIKSAKVGLSFTAKDWVTLSLSLLALTVSAGSAYFSIVQRTDDIGLVFRSPPLVQMHGDQLILEKALGYPTVLINSGNRPAVVSSINMQIFQAKTASDVACSGRQMTAFQSDFNAIVVKDKEVTAVTLRLLRPRFESTLAKEVILEKSTFFQFPLNEELKSEKYITVEACLEVEISTPSLAYHSAKIRVATLTVDRTGIYLGGDKVSPGWVPRPHVIYKHSGTIFTD